jgi:hypothetical protein
MKSKILICAFALSLSLPVVAAPKHSVTPTVKETPTDKTLLSKKTEAMGSVVFGPASKKEIKGVKLSDSVMAEVGGSQVELKRVTSGLRQKKVAVFWASVYVAQVFTNANVDFTSIEKVRESLIAGLPVVVTMTFVRDVSIDKIVDGYKEVFSANGANVEQDPYAQILTAVKQSGDVKDRQTYYFTFAKSTAGKERFSFWTNGKERYALDDASPGVLDHLFTMWFGKAPDSGLEQLQEETLKHDAK